MNGRVIVRDEKGNATTRRMNGTYPAVTVTAEGQPATYDPAVDITVYIPVKDENGDVVIFGENGPRKIKLAADVIT